MAFHQIPHKCWFNEANSGGPGLSPFGHHKLIYHWKKHWHASCTLSFTELDSCHCWKWYTVHGNHDMWQKTTHQKECCQVCLLNETNIPHWKLVDWREITPGRRGRSAPHYNESYGATHPAGHCTDTASPQFQSSDQETEPAWGTHPQGSAPGSGCCHHQLQTGHSGLGSGPYHVGCTAYPLPAPSPPTPPPHSHRTQLW